MSDSYIGLDQVHELYLAPPEESKDGWGPRMGDREKNKLNDDWVYESDYEVEALGRNQKEQSDTD